MGAWYILGGGGTYIRLQSSQITKSFDTHAVKLLKKTWGCQNGNTMCWTIHANIFFLLIIKIIQIGIFQENVISF